MSTNKSTQLVGDNYHSYKSFIKRKSKKRKEDLDWLEKHKPASAKKKPKKQPKKKYRTLTVKEREKKRLNQKKGAFYQGGLRKKATKSELHLKTYLEKEYIPFSFQKLFFDTNHCYIVDFYFKINGVRLVVEVDGKSHDVKNAKEYDERRTGWLENRRHLKVIRFKNEEVMNDVEEVMNKITDEFR